MEVAVFVLYKVTHHWWEGYDLPEMIGLFVSEEEAKEFAEDHNIREEVREHVSESDDVVIEEVPIFTLNRKWEG